MPLLLELQHAMRDSLVRRDHEVAAAWLSDPSLRERLDIYRNTFLAGLTKALRLSYPAVDRLVGAEFFDFAAHVFIADHPPRAAYLDLYGGEFPAFLRDFSPAASLAYLADVARLEWAINGAMHASDAEPLDLAKLAAIEPEDQNRLGFVAHPSVRLLRADYPVDRIWLAVLAGDDGVLTALDVGAGAVSLLVERRATGVEVVRLDDCEWRFLATLCGGERLLSAIDSAADLDAPAALAEHLAAGRFVAFNLTADEATPRSHEAAAWGQSHE
jgi:hypothetical protein